MVGCQPYAPAAFNPRKYYWYSFLLIGRSLVRSQLVSLEFFIDIKSYYGPGVDSASNINEYQEYFLGLKAAGA